MHSAQRQLAIITPVHGSHVSFHPATWTTRTDYLWEVGGWPGLVLEEPAIIYRHHQHQTSQLRSPVHERIEYIRRSQRK